MSAQVFLALGSNIDAEKNMKKAAVMLRKHWPSVRFSSVYKTAPQGYEDQEDFLNAVATMETNESPEKIVTKLHDIEHALGKAPAFKDGPRTIDLDLLLYGNSQLVTRNPPAGRSLGEGWELVIPHPRMASRRFVLEPLCELIDPHATHPVLKKTWRELLQNVQEQRCEKTVVLL